MVIGLGSCGPSTSELRTPSAALTALQPTLSPTPKESKHWRRPRFISISEAVARLQRHVDVPVVLPRSRAAGLPNLKGWLADPKYLEWKVVDGARVGGMKIRKDRQILILDYGLAVFDGCGDRSMAIETNVLGQPALINIANGHEWTSIIWPVTDEGSSGRYGISGTFYPEAMMLLAESMELARLEVLDHQKNC